MLIFCENCQYYKHKIINISSYHYCYSPSLHNWHGKCSGEPAKLNKHNNCDMFVKKIKKKRWWG